MEKFSSAVGNAVGKVHVPPDETVTCCHCRIRPPGNRWLPVTPRTEAKDDISGIWLAPIPTSLFAASPKSTFLIMIIYRSGGMIPAFCRKEIHAYWLR